mmetsp:Transcript_17459/g.27898  ORF Transcript_17459/g.27898 Transcript_17459/m.27898 type:complete len:316 (-) Transcript_17459:91-1038(-)|eukprot:jgi/Bigna1/66457/fgenesh1_pg.1_\
MDYSSSHSYYMRKLLRNSGLGRDSMALLGMSGVQRSSRFVPVEERRKRKRAPPSRSFPSHGESRVRVKRAGSSLSQILRGKRNGGSSSSSSRTRKASLSSPLSSSSSSSRKQRTRERQQGVRKQKPADRTVVREAIRAVLGLPPGTIEIELEEQLFTSYSGAGKEKGKEGSDSKKKEGKPPKGEATGATSSDYVAKSREFVQTLRHEASKRNAIKNGKIQAEKALQFVFSLSKDRQREIDHVKEQKKIKVRKMSNKKEAQLGVLCKECGSETIFKTILYQKRDIGKCETWGNKSDVSQRYILNCSTCGYEKTIDE